jgi:hypothetical protein
VDYRHGDGPKGAMAAFAMGAAEAEPDQRITRNRDHRVRKTAATRR